MAQEEYAEFTHSSNWSFTISTGGKAPKMQVFCSLSYNPEGDVLGVDNIQVNTTIKHRVILCVLDPVFTEGTL